MKKALLLFTCTLLLQACGNKTGFQVPDPASSDYPEDQVCNISDYISETSLPGLSGDSVVFTQTEKIYPGGEYIIAIRYNGIMLFSKEGNILSTIAEEGRGPGEVSFVKDIKTDLQTEITNDTGLIS